MSVTRTTSAAHHRKGRTRTPGFRAPAHGLLALVAAGGPLATAAQVTEVRYGDVDPPVIAQRDVTIRHTTSIHPVDPTAQPLECSSLASTPAGLVLPSDRHNHVLFLLPATIEEGAVAIGLPEPHPIIESERLLLMDAECIAARPIDGGRRSEVLVFSSMSNDPSGARRPMRERAARVRLGDDGTLPDGPVSVISLEHLRGALDESFTALGIEPYMAFNSDRGENTRRWGSVEGIAWAPEGDRLIGGMRTPLAGDRAMLFVMEGVDDAFDAGDGSLLRVSDLFSLDLGGRGISDLAWDRVTGGFLITAARSNGPRHDPSQPYPLQQVDSALFWWSGSKSDAPRLVARMPDMNIDAVCRVGESALIALGSDEGDVSEERRGHQSAITLLHFIDVPAAPEAGAP